MIIYKVATKKPFQMMLMKDNDVVQPVPADAADNALHIAIPPGTTGGGRKVL